VFALTAACAFAGCDKARDSAETTPRRFQSLPAAFTVPRYHFNVGDELVYRQTKSEDLIPEEDDPVPSGSYEWHVYVVRQNDDGSWRLLIRSEVTTRSWDDDHKPVVRFQNDFLGYCDLEPDGSFDVNGTMGANGLFSINPDHLFPPLPGNVAECVRGWSSSSPITEDVQQFSGRQQPGDYLVFAGTVASPSDAAYDQLVTRTVGFDLKRGLADRIVRESKADWEKNPWHVRHTVELVDTKTHSPAEIAEFDRQAQTYLKLFEGFMSVYNRVSRLRSVDDARAAIAPYREAIDAGKEAASRPEFQELFTALQVIVDREAEGLYEGVRRHEKLFAMEPLDWETTDFDNQSRKLVDYRGKVLFLDFWYRGCGHCIDALPKIKQLHAHYAGKDVVVLGMNNDRLEADARHVIDAFDVPYTNLRAQDIAKEYLINSWPTFLVLDQTGRVHEIFEGNSEDLVADVKTTVDELLANPVTSP
jgi:thiol-disulfide isomerase/thioredoxin